MAKHTIKKGLDLPISGAPEQRVEDGAKPTLVGLIADDYPGMRPRMLVAEGDQVKLGQQLFEDRKTPGVYHAAPGAGVVKGIHRGARRALISVEIELADTEDALAFAAFNEAAGNSGETARALLVESGAWTALRTRPYGKVPGPETTAAAIFVTAMDTNPLAADVATVLAALDGQGDFARGLDVLGKLTEGKVFLCQAPGAQIGAGASGVTVEEFAGPHPAGLPGLHIHTLLPANRNRTVWYIGYQEVVAIGHLFRTGKLLLDRVVSLAGPGVATPRLLKTRLGACLTNLTGGQLKSGDIRLVSGSVLAGRTVSAEANNAFLGRYHTQVTALKEGTERHFLGWAGPGFNKFSLLPAFFSKLLGKKSFDLTTDTNGGARAMVPIGMYERVMPMDILPTFLLRALASKDLERAEALGCMELEEEDLALCTFVCPSKIDYGQLLRESLTQIEKES